MTQSEESHRNDIISEVRTARERYSRPATMICGNLPLAFERMRH